MQYGENLVKKRENVSKRNINLNIKTYERLEKYKIKLMNERGDSRVTYDDAINTLLEKRIES